MKDRLDALIGQQQKNFDRLLSLSQKQLCILQSGEGEGNVLEKLMDERTALFVEIGALDARLRDAVAGHEGEEHPGLEKLQQAVREILETDAQCGNLLRDEKAKVFDQIQSLSKGSAAMKGYGRKGDGGSSRFLSRKM